VKACTLSMKCVYVCEREALLTIKKGLTVGKVVSATPNREEPESSRPASNQRDLILMFLVSICKRPRAGEPTSAMSMTQL
jgi:hypothetical protein